MASKNNNSDFTPDTNGKRKSEFHLPKYFRTVPNSKFLASTLDQLMQPGMVEKISGYVGRKTTKSFNYQDNYISDVSTQRENYQFDPAAVIKDSLGNVTFYKDYMDYVNQLKTYNRAFSNDSLHNQQEFYTWNPHINWDMFVNFREYYWMPNGPETVTVTGTTTEVESTYTVTTADYDDNITYIFSPDGLTNNPTLKLFRDVTYRFDLSVTGLPFTLRTKRDLDDEFLLEETVFEQGIENGIVEFTPTSETPDVLWYVAGTSIDAAGMIKIANIEEASVLDVEAEIIGKKNYTTGKGFELTNGMKVRFAGDVTPASYASGTYFVEGVGSKIKLVPQSQMNVATQFVDTRNYSYDADPYDEVPFDEAIGYPTQKDYVVINRAAINGNLWSRYNRWVHKSVIEKSAEINSNIAALNQDARATRPIIEFHEHLKLHNFGTKSKLDIDLIDDFTTDAFSTIEGTIGYNVDGVDLQDGDRIIFLADTDELVQGKVYQVNFVTFGDGSGRSTNSQIALTETDDTLPLFNETVFVRKGTKYKGSAFHYDGTNWVESQLKTEVNQIPLFDVFDNDGYSYSDASIYESTNFKGTSVFSYATGTGASDAELGFPLKYRSIENIGDILFNFDFSTDYFQYTINNALHTKYTKTGFVRLYSDREVYNNSNGWVLGNTLQQQPVIRQYVYDGTFTTFEVDVYNDSGSLNDLNIIVYCNNKLEFEGTDYTTSVNGKNLLEIQFVKPRTIGDNIVIKSTSPANKNENGYYEIPNSFEHNPQNNNPTEFSLGEVNDHVQSIVENVSTFSGAYPGTSNLRDIGQVTHFGKKFVKHSAPLNFSLLNILDKHTNLVNALRLARRDYGKFKRQFLKAAFESGFSGPAREHVTLILSQMNNEKIEFMPYYFTDMVAYKGAVREIYPIEDETQTYFLLKNKFDLTELSKRAVLVYLNGTQLIHGKDYTFNDDGFCVITADKAVGDTVEIFEYENTNGCYIPATPSKLGLYPLFVPEIYVDDTYQEPTKVIQGHDGSKIVAYNDYRDELLLELELRIFNNVKQEYNPNIFDINNFYSGLFRNTGFSLDQINYPMLADFVQWLKLVDEDYTSNSFFDRLNSWTFNYSKMTSPTGESSLGFWRGVFIQAYDTDRPHTHPWEMLGFSLKPLWWEDTYGPAPYTSDNLILWQDLQDGVIRNPNGVQINDKYKRPGLLEVLPVNESGELLSPSDSGLAKDFNTKFIKESFKFGDHSPVETAWRRSSEYPFSILTSYFINSPSLVSSVAFDRSRQNRNGAGQIVYAETNEHIRLEDIVFPNTYKDSTQIYTSGLVNYIADYLASEVTTLYDVYRNNFKEVKTQLGIKLGGFTDKSKIRLQLDSRTPSNKGNVFVPEENYSVFFNVSSPIETISYSGVIIELTPTGFKISGYDDSQPSFNYFRHIPLDNDPVVTIGGSSEPYTTWQTGKFYANGAIVLYNNVYYRVTKQHTSAGFESDNFAKLVKLPTVGGREVILRKAFDTTQVLSLTYGTILKTVQDVCDFLQGYGNYLENKGFVFDHYRDSDNVVDNWKTSSREFAFWTTAGWSEGTVLSLSPVASYLKYRSNYSTVDNIFDTFFGYTLLKVDGRQMPQGTTISDRQNPNEFVLRPRNTEEGIYSIKLPLVQKEHVILLDNSTIFSDLIYRPETGYRQERIKLLGYRTVEWDGSFNIPGFVFDQATIEEWKPNNDYWAGDTVKYKEFFYTAQESISGTELFNSALWTKLEKRPESKLIPNLDYKTNQFTDFYSLDTDSFDSDQQRMAQHLIGYQNRTYLENIINDDVSQYKFYQGFIQDKGSTNAFKKLFDSLSSADKESLEFYEEWAIKEGQYGAAEAFDEVEYAIDESKVRLSPQPYQLVKSTTGEEVDLIYRVLRSDAYVKPDSYDHAPFPAKQVTTKTYIRDAGYVNASDIQHSVVNYYDILNLDFTQINRGDLIWVGNDENPHRLIMPDANGDALKSYLDTQRTFHWNVYKHNPTDAVIESVTGGQTEFTVNLTTTPKGILVGELFGVFDLISTTKNPTDSDYSSASQNKSAIGAFYKVTKVELNKVTFETSTPVEDIESCRGRLTRLQSVRVADSTEFNRIASRNTEKDDLFYIDDIGDGTWRTLKNTAPYVDYQRLSSLSVNRVKDFGSSIVSNSRGTMLYVGSPYDDDGRVYVYRRPNPSGDFTLLQTISPEVNIADSYKEWFSETTYLKGEKVKYNDRFWQVNETHTTGAAFQRNLYTYLRDSDLQRFGTGLSLTPDEKYLIIGAPGASNVRSKYQGMWNGLNSYSRGDVVSNNDVLWEAIDRILPEASTAQVTGFSSVLELVEDSGNINPELEQTQVLLTGKHPLTNVSTQHVLVRAPKEMYESVSPGARITLYWNLKTIANQYQETFEDKFPFNGTIPQLTTSFINNTHRIIEKVDAIITLNSTDVSVIVGDQINADGVTGTVTRKFTDGTITSLYIADATGFFESTGLLYNESGNLVGEFTLAAPLNSVNDRDQFGGFWLFSTDEYTPVVDVNDFGRGLIYKDLLPLEDTAPITRPLYNVVDSLGDASIVGKLSHQGNPGYFESYDPVYSNLFFVRSPLALSNELTTGDSISLRIPSLLRTTGEGSVLSTIGLTNEITDKEHVIYDIWDGWFNLQYTNFWGTGTPYDPRPGDVVTIEGTTDTAVVTGVIRDGINAQVFVKGVVGDWTTSETPDEYPTLLLEGVPEDTDVHYIETKVIGRVTSKNFANVDNGIGKLLVFDAGQEVGVGTANEITGQEYWLYSTRVVEGSPIPANIPSNENKDWKAVTKIPAGIDGTPSGLANQGYIGIYEADARSGKYDLVETFISPAPREFDFFGNNIKSTSSNNLITTFVHAGNKEIESDTVGRIFILRNGTDNSGNDYSWESTRSTRFTGAFNSSWRYSTGDITYINNFMYEAKTNIEPGVFQLSDWSVVSSAFDYVGHVPNDLGLVPTFDDEDMAFILGQNQISKFGNSFSVSQDGEILVASVTYKDESAYRVAVYRKSISGLYQLYQAMKTTDNTTGFGQSVSLSPDGTYMAIGIPYDDTIQLDQGKVNIYKQIDGRYQKIDTLYSQNNERVELFGYNVELTNNSLAVTGRNTDTIITTTMDNNTTLLDQGFTALGKTIEDTGCVYLYERFNDNFVYGQTLNVQESTRDFGLFVKHTTDNTYVGVPTYEAILGYPGGVIEFKKSSSQNIWETHAQPKNTVDVDKVKRVIVYDKSDYKFNQTLDYIDPLQGKIAGPAEQELTYKTFRDPATYAEGDRTTVTVGKNNAWSTAQVGQLWWDTSTVKFINPYQSTITYSTSVWNTQFEGSTIDVYEWVESELLPSEWDEISGTSEGFDQGVSGTSRYGDTNYVTNRVYDSITQTFTNKYYYWVKDASVVPQLPNRYLSALDVANLIKDPAGQGYTFVAFISPTEFTMYNANSLFVGTNRVFGVQYWTGDATESNIHTQYRLISDGLAESRPTASIETKWFDSLIGYDENQKRIPNLELSPKERYGVLTYQSWFVNRTEACKQVIERLNNVLIKNLIVDDKDISRLESRDPEPDFKLGLYDIAIDTFAELDLVGTSLFKKPVLSTVLVDGELTRVDIAESGRGYLTSPSFNIIGDGTGAEIEFELNTRGGINAVNVINKGEGYTYLHIEIRGFTVLVLNDDNVSGKWSLYSKATSTSNFERVRSQSYDVSLFWDYVDWYATGYSEFTAPDYTIDGSQDLLALPSNRGDIVKISNIGSGGWLLLEKIDNQINADYTINYKTVGRQNGTIQFSNLLYAPDLYSGYDVGTYDTNFYDLEPTQELRIIFETVRDKLFIEELLIEYNQLFLASLRYVFSEQPFVDWAFKTSFVRAKHNLGSLGTAAAFKNDSLISYQNYINEVKPYKTKVRQFISSYDKLDTNSTVVTDFDLPALFNNETGTVVAPIVKVIDGVIVSEDTDLTVYPNKNWLDNVGFGIDKVLIKDTGLFYNEAPIVEFDNTGTNGTGAAAFVRLGGNGRIIEVVITNPGRGYLKAPVVNLVGPVLAGGRTGELLAQLGKPVVRGINTTIKFDRVSGRFTVTTVTQEETFTGGENQFTFNTVFPIEQGTQTIEIYVNGDAISKYEYTYENVVDDSLGYTKEIGRITFRNPPPKDATVSVKYNRAITTLDAADRINFYYDPKTGQYGKDLGQLMDGVDYGGVEVISYGFGGTTGWDSLPWGVGTYDAYDSTFEDEVFVLDGSTLALELSKPLENGVVYNVYRNGVRLDDPNYGTEEQNNEDALMPSIIGDGVTQVVDLGMYDIPAGDGDTFAVRKITSDGSYQPDPQSFDAVVQGGNLNYTTALGLNAEDINIDGDGFVTPLRAKGPEEVVPGQVLDTVDIQVFEKPQEGSSAIIHRNYIANGLDNVFEIGENPLLDNYLFVKVGYDVLDSADYTIDRVTKSVVLSATPVWGTKVSITLLNLSGSKVLELDTIVSDGSTTTIETPVRWKADNQLLITVDGVKINASLIESDDGNTDIVMETPPAQDKLIRFALFENTTTSDINYSEVSIDNFIADGSQTEFALSQTPFSQEPGAYNVLVVVDNDDVLNAGYNELITLTNDKEYELNFWQLSLDATGVFNIYLNGTELEQDTDWEFLGGSTIKILTEYNEGDILHVYTVDQGEYAFGKYDGGEWTNTPGLLQLAEVYPLGTPITVYQFSNNESQKLQRQQFIAEEKYEIPEHTADWYDYRRLRRGFLKLESPARNVNNVWVVQNNVLLKPSIDYSITSDGKYVQLVSEPADGDIIETLHFSNQTLVSKFGWRQFKDMLNRTHYKRLDNNGTYALTNDLNWYDKTITLDGGETITAPTEDKKYPGIIWINGERIEYFVKEGNVLKQLRRGTLGTSVSEYIPAGSTVIDQNKHVTVPYMDEYISKAFDTDGETNSFTLDFDVNSEHEIEVFLAGRRLRKGELQMFDPNLAQDSPIGDVVLPPEFTVAGSIVTLTTIPEENQKVIVVKKVGKIWNEIGKSLADSDTDIAKFLRLAYVDLLR